MPWACPFLRLSSKFLNTLERHYRVIVKGMGSFVVVVCLKEGPRGANRGLTIFGEAGKENCRSKSHHQRPQLLTQARGHVTSGSLISVYSS